MKKLSATGLLFLSIMAFAQSHDNHKSSDIEVVTISKKKKKKYKNPAHEILAKLVERKPINNPETLDSYSSENHTRMEIMMNSLGNKFQNKQVYKDLKNIMKSYGNNTNPEESAVLPIFISENISDYYYQKSPNKTAEFIKKSKVEGVGIEDDTLFAQLISSTFIKYNFYNNHINVLDKVFISPINDNFALLYDYELLDRNHEENDQGFYKIAYKPKRASDLAFEGTLLISHSNYSLYKIEAKISPSANLNFINNIKIEQELTELEDTEIFMPIKSRISVETAKLGKNGMGGLLKFYTSSKNIKINQNFDKNTFKHPLVMMPNASQNDEAYWETNRHEPLTTGEQKMYATIQEIKKLPSIKSYLDIIETIMNGYYKIGKIELGPILYTGGYNDIEGIRLRAGFRTTTAFSRKWVLGGYLGYGFKDNQFKYGGNVDYIISREPWIQAGVSASRDLDQVALQYGNSYVKTRSLFDAFSKNGKISVRKPFWKNNYQAYFQMDILNSITQKFIFNHSSFSPLFDFSYFDENGQAFHNFKTSEMIWETQWKPGRKNIQSENRNQQIKLANNIYYPTVTFRFTHGIKGLFGGDFEYNKLHLNIKQNIPMGILGQGEISLTGGIIPDKVPYPLLENHLGNEFVFYNKDAFNMMRFFEFTSNKYASLQYTQNLEGLITNSIPLIKKLSWRNHITFNYLIGNLDDKFNSEGILNSLNNKPYMELGYGISNIFRFLRVDFTHRLTHLNNTNVNFTTNPSRFNIKLSAQIKL